MLLQNRGYRTRELLRMTAWMKPKRYVVMVATTAQTTVHVSTPRKVPDQAFMEKMAVKFDRPTQSTRDSGGRLSRL